LLLFRIGPADSFSGLPPDSPPPVSVRLVPARTGVRGGPSRVEQPGVANAPLGLDL